MQSAHRARAALLIVLSVAASISTVAGSVAQTQADFLTRFEGSYSGTVRRAVTGSFGLPNPAASESSGGEKRDLTRLMQINEEALRSHQRDEPVILQASILPAAQGWTVELRHRDDQFGVPLQKTVTVKLPRALQPLSDVEVDGLPPGPWTARALLGQEFLTVFLVELDSRSTPAQIQISLQSAGDDVAFILWRLDRDGRRTTAWTGILGRHRK